jgi:integrase
VSNAKRSNGQGTVYPITTEGCAHCATHSKDHKKHLGRWQAKVIINGQPAKRNAPNRTEALRLIDTIKVERVTGNLVLGASPMLDTYLQVWNDERDPLLPYAGVKKHAHSTIGGYRRRAALLGAAIGKIQLRKLEPADVRRALAHISARGLSQTTVGDCRDYLATVLNFAMRERPAKVAFNAAALVESIARDDVEKYVLDEEEAGRFLTAAAQYPRFFSAMLVAIHVGPRAGEMWGARWKAIDWTKRELHISESLYWIGADAELERGRAAATKDPKTEHGDRHIVLGKRAIDALREHRDSEAKRLGRVPHQGGFIWTNEEGGPVDHRNLLRDVFYPICAAAKIPYIGEHRCQDPEHHKGCPNWLTFHGLRHSAATLALAETKDILAVSRMLGHASTEFTMDVYGHVLAKQQQAIADYMDEAVHGAR